MKKSFILIFTACLIACARSKKIEKCYEVIPRCPKLSSPCPTLAYCANNSTLSQRENGCCCIPPCPENEIFLDVPEIAADPTCNLRNPYPAGAVGPLPGCYCMEGFVRHEMKCVSVDECPQPKTDCGKNEYFDECGEAEDFTPTCDNLDPSQDSMSPPVCIQGCYCKPGYVRNKDWKCIKRSKCPSPKCGENEVYAECNTNCGDPTCKNKEVYSCGFKCKKGCFCDSGFVRNKQNKCVPPSECIHDEL